MSGLRTGQRMGDTIVVDMLAGGLTDPFNRMLMGEIAERMACDEKISRSEKDEYALSSHQQAALAQSKGRFSQQVVPVTIPGTGGRYTVRDNERVKTGISLEELARMRPAFAKNGTVTAGNVSGINDAAAAIVLMDWETAARREVHPQGRLVAYAHVGVDPLQMGLGTVPATRRVLEKAGLVIDEMDVIEVNEAFAVQTIAVVRALELPLNKVNPNGAAIALGHHVGATGAILIVKVLAELERIGGHYGLVTLCIGGGQGMAMIVERLALAGKSSASQVLD